MRGARKQNTHYILFFVIGVVTLIIVISAATVSTRSRKEPYTNQTSSKIQLVISRYNEDLAWLNQAPFNRYSHIIYNKGNNTEFTTNEKTVAVIPLKNVGREGHTYLHHIIQNYSNDKLAEITVFLTGSLNIPHKKNKSELLIREIEAHGDTVFVGSPTVNGIQDLHDFSLDKWSSTDEKNKSVNPESKLETASIRPFGKWFESHFPGKTLDFTCRCGIFAVHRRDIIKDSNRDRDTSYYEKFLAQLQNSSNPEVGHYIERSWVTIFHPYHNAKFVNG